MREIKQLFIEPDCDQNPFFAGFGNKATDALAYSSVGIAQDRVYIINPKGVIHKFGSKSTQSYTQLNEKVDELFPPIDSSNIDHEANKDPSYWKNQWGDSYEMSVFEEFQDKPK